MNIINTRSPFIVTINEPLQIGGKIVLSMWNEGHSEPTPQYTLTKSIPSTTQRALSWNISNYIDEFIDIIAPIKVGYVETENPLNWCHIKYQTYKLIGTTYTLVDTVYAQGIKGFEIYTDGRQVGNTNSVWLMCRNFIDNNYPINSEFGYFNIMIDSSVNDYKIIYTNSDSTYTYNVVYESLQMYKVPYTNFNLGDPALPCTITIYNFTDDYIENILQSNIVEACKYTPVECAFINSRGGWQFLTFFKAQSNSINVKGTDYNLLPDAVDYNVQRGQSKTFNINGSQTVKLNTGWVAENYNELIHDLLLSETILIDNKPAQVKTKSHTYKTQLKDKMINFEIEFEYSFDLINNVI